MAETLLTAQQVRDRLGIDTSTIYRMAGDGRLPAVRIGRQWRFSRVAIEALLSPGGTDDLEADATVVASHLHSNDTSSLLPPVATIVATLEVIAPVLGVSLVVIDLSGKLLTDVVNPAPAIAARLDDRAFLAACGTEWRQLAEDTDFTTRLERSAFGFMCARSFVRHGSALVAMVLAGGIAPDDADDAGLFHLNSDQRSAVIETLPRIASLLSQLSASDAYPTPRS